MDLTKKAYLSPTKLFLFLPALKHIHIEQGLVHLFNVLTGCKHSLLSIYKKKGLDIEVNNMAMAIDLLVLHIL